MKKATQLQVKEKISVWTKDFILLCLAVLFMAIAFYFLIPTLPLYLTDVIHVEKKYIGIIIASFTLSALFIRPFTGYVIDRWGRKWIYIVSFLFMAVFFNFYVVALTASIMFALRFMHGLAWGVTSTVGSTIAVDLLPVKNRGEGLGIYGLSMPLAMSVGPLIGFALVAKWNYNVMFIAGFALCLIGFFLASLIKYPKYLKPKEPTKFTFNNLFEKKSIPVSVNIMFITIPYGGIVSFIAIYAKEIGIMNGSLFFLILAIGIAMARLLAGRIFDKHGPKMIFIIGIILLIIGLPILAFVRNSYGFFASALLLGIGNGVIFPVTQAMVNNMVLINRRGAANSTLFTAFDVGIGGGMILTGFLGDLISLQNTFLVLAGICILGLIFALSFVFTHYDENKLSVDLEIHPLIE